MIKIKLIINADDFGYSKGINYGILEGFKNGVVTSTTLMTNMPGTSHAFQLINEYKELLNVGIHLVLGAGKPLSENSLSLIDSKGFFKNIEKLLVEAEIEDIEKEFNLQMKKFLSYGIKPTHIDCHQHSHSNKKILKIVLDMAEKYELPVRILQKNKIHLKENEKSFIIHPESFDGGFYGDFISEKLFKKIVLNNQSYKTVEIMCHPGYVDQILFNNSSYNISRPKELDILTNKETFDFLKINNIELINYSYL